jgi:hypothetical protein
VRVWRPDTDPTLVWWANQSEISNRLQRGE